MDIILPDLFPIYCRLCHKQIDANATICPFCKSPQGLSSPEPDLTALPPPPSALANPVANASAPPTAPDLDICPICQTQVTAGDLFCRACGSPLVPGARLNDAEIAKAYGVSAMTAALFCGGPAAIVLGFVAVAKGSRSLGCSAIVLTVLFIVLGGVLSVSVAQQLLAFLGTHGQALPGR